MAISTCYWTNYTVGKTNPSGTSEDAGLCVEVLVLLCPAPNRRGIKRCFSLTSDVCLSVAYIVRNSRTERPRKTKIGTEVAHVTRDSDTTFKVKRSKVNLQGAPCSGGVQLDHLQSTVSHAGTCQAACATEHTSVLPRAGSGVVRMDPLRFLAGCRTRRLNQA